MTPSWLLKSLVRLKLRQFHVPRDVMRFAFKAHRKKNALIAGDVRLSFRELEARVLRLNHWMLSAGVVAETPVLIWVAREDWLLLCELAAYENGAAVVAFPEDAPVEQVIEALTRLDIRLVMASPAQLARLDGALADRPHLLVDDALEQRLAGYPPRWADYPLKPDQISGYGYSSGTTGQPKIMRNRQGMPVRSLKLVIKNIHILFKSHENLALAGIPLLGAGSGLILPALAAGMTLVLPRDRSPRALSAIIRELGITRMFVTPSQLIDLLDLPMEERSGWKSLSHLLYGTEWMPVAKLEEALHCFGPILQQGYGCSEVLPPVALLQPHQHWHGGKPAPRSILAASGYMVPEVAVQVVDENDRPLPEGAIGQVLIKGPTVFDGYWQQSALTAQVLRNGWLHTGDMGRVERGLLYILGRRADLIHRRDEVIYPRQVEDLIHDHPAVKETAFVQVGDRALLACSLRQGWRNHPDKPALTQELSRFVQERTEPHQWPDAIHILDELPRSPLYKLLRRQVRHYLSQIPAS